LSLLTIKLVFVTQATSFHILFEDPLQTDLCHLQGTHTRHVLVSHYRRRTNKLSIGQWLWVQGTWWCA